MAAHEQMSEDDKTKLELIIDIIQNLESSMICEVEEKERAHIESLARRMFRLISLLDERERAYVRNGLMALDGKELQLDSKSRANFRRWKEFEQQMFSEAFTGALMRW